MWLAMAAMLAPPAATDNALMPATAAPPPDPRPLAAGTAFAAAAGLMWGLVFVVPLLLPDYAPVLLSVSRYLAFGLIALPLAWLDRRRLAALTRADWTEALKLAAVGNLLYYGCLAGAIQHAGAPLPSMIIGTLPVWIAVLSNRRNLRRDGRLPWRRLAPSLVLIALGLACVNRAEWQALQAQAQAADAARAGAAAALLGRYASGAALAIGALLCWTWYPIRNADWLRAHAERSSSTWATAQGLMTLPLAAAGLLLLLAWQRWGDGSAAPPAPAALLGPTPLRFVGLMAVLGLLASWLGTLCWNQASQRLPTHLAGQLIVFETLAALAYAFVLRGAAPEAVTAVGIALLVAGVALALRVRPQPQPQLQPLPQLQPPPSEAQAG